MLWAGRVAARVSAGGINHGHLLVLLLHHFGNVGGELDVVVRMAVHFEDVYLVAVIGRGIGRRLLRLRMGAGSD